MAEVTTFNKKEYEEEKREKALRDHLEELDDIIDALVTVRIAYGNPEYHGSMLDKALNNTLYRLENRLLDWADQVTDLVSYKDD